MVEAAIRGDLTRVQQLGRALAAARPTRGDRARARQLNARGLGLAKTERYDDAVTAFQAAHEADRADPEIRENLGIALLKAGRAEEAERALLAALEIGPRRASAWGSLAFAYAKLGRHTEAVKLLLTAYRFAPNQRRAIESYTRQASSDPDPKVRAMLTDALAALREARPRS
jgi:Flp pilus assembly protein TadD